MARLGSIPHRVRTPERGQPGRGQPDLRVIDASGAPVSSAHEPVLAGNIEGRLLGALFVAAAVMYLGIYALEAPVRFALYTAGKDNLIFVRDVLIVGPLSALLAAYGLRLRLHPAFVVFGMLMAFHGLVQMGTIGSFMAAGYGVKILINLLFGFFVAGLLLQPGNKVLTILAMIWCVTILGVCLDKFVLTFPWTGIKTIVGDLNVDVSRDWQIQDPLARRVAGFTRSSISVAAFLPALTIIVMSRTRNWILRAFLMTVSLGAVALTTQKGSIIAFAPIGAVLCLPFAYRLKLLRFGCIAFMLIAIALPFLVMNLHMSHGTGVFSTESVYLRVAYTWPQAWQWIMHHSMLVFGVGLGGIGGPQRIYAPDNFNPADNFFLLLYAYFGVFAIIYLLVVCYLLLRRVTGSEERVVTATAIIAFIFGYGAVVSIIEDQSAALFLGAALGVLWRETIPVRVAPPRWAAVAPRAAGNVHPIGAAAPAVVRIR
jgi:hypothetical protein